MSTVVGEVEVDVVNVYNDAPFVIRVRGRGVWRLNLALRILALAVFGARVLGVGIRVVPDGALVVPRRRLIAMGMDAVERQRFAAFINEATPGRGRDA